MLARMLCWFLAIAQFWGLLIGQVSLLQDIPFQIGHTHRNLTAVWPGKCVNTSVTSSKEAELIVMSPRKCENVSLTEFVTQNNDAGLTLVTVDHVCCWPRSTITYSCENFTAPARANLHVQRQCPVTTDPATFTLTYISHINVGDLIAETAAHSGWTEIALISEANYLTADFNVPCYAERCPTLATYTIDSTETPANVISAFDNISELREKTILVYCSVQCLQLVMQTANKYEDSRTQQGYFLIKYSWVLIVRDGSWLDKVAEAVANVTNVAAVVPASQTRTVTQDYVEEIIEEAELLFQKDESSYGLQLPCRPSNSECRSPLYEDYFHQNTTAQNQKPAKRTLPHYSHDIYTAMYVNHSKAREFQLVGKFDNGKLDLHTELYPNKQYGFNNRTLIISTNFWGPFMSKKDGEYVGLCMDMLLAIAESLNFSYVMVEPPDGSWGAYDNTTGTWDGLVRQLQMKEIDMVVAPIAIESDRATVMDFCDVPMYYENSIIMIRAPGSDLDAILVLFLKPFRGNVWLCIAASVFLCSIVMWVINRFSPREQQYQQQCGLGAYRHSLWTSFGIIVNQSSVHLPMAPSGRIILSCWWLYCLVILATYSGNLIAFLTVVKHHMPFDTLEGLVSQSEYSFGLLSGTVWDVLFMKANLPVYKRFRTKMLRFNESDPSVLSGSHKQHIDKVLRSKYAYVTDQTQFEMALLENCQFARMKETFAPLSYSIGLQKNSAYQDMINQIMNYLHDNGLIYYWRKKHWPETSECLRYQSNAGHEVLQLSHVRGIFYTLVGLLSLAFVVFAVEMVIWHAHKRFKLPFGRQHTLHFS